MLGVEARFLLAATIAEFRPNVDQFIDDGCDMVIWVGQLLGERSAVDAAVAKSRHPAR